MTILEWPTSDRPREKLIKYQANTLADSRVIGDFIAAWEQWPHRNRYGTRTFK